MAAFCGKDTKHNACCRASVHLLSYRNWNDIDIGMQHYDSLIHQARQRFGDTNSGQFCRMLSCCKHQDCWMRHCERQVAERRLSEGPQGSTALCHALCRYIVINRSHCMQDDMPLQALRFLDTLIQGPAAEGRLPARSLEAVNTLKHPLKLLERYH